MSRRFAGRVAVLAAAVLVVTGCGSTAPGEGGGAGADGTATSGVPGPGDDPATVAPTGDPPTEPGGWRRRPPGNVAPVEAGRVRRVVVAPDKFKGTLSAEQAAAVMTEAVHDRLPDAEVVVVPVADGGEGTVDALLSAGAVEHRFRVTGPLGGPVQARLAVGEGTAYVEAAQACGLVLVTPTPDTALRAHSGGVGELVRHALDLRCREIVVGVGGVACTDGGSGALGALGARDVGGQRLDGGGAGLGGLTGLDLSGLDARLRGTRVVVATDVTNPLVGPDGAAAVYGPQKGAGPQEVDRLDEGLRRWATLLEAATGRDVAHSPGAGAAGGLAGGLVAALGAEVASGVELVLERVGARDVVAGADLVITGEGRLDAQSLHGKAPVGVAGLAHEHAVPVLAVAGTVDPDARERLAERFDAIWSVAGEVGEQAALQRAAASLGAVTRTALDAWLAARERTARRPRPTG